jgi:hypothetical protein
MAGLYGNVCAKSCASLKGSSTDEKYVLLLLLVLAQIGLGDEAFEHAYLSTQLQDSSFVLFWLLDVRPRRFGGGRSKSDRASLNATNVSKRRTNSVGCRAL